MADLSFSVNFLNVSFGDDDLSNDSAIRDTPFLQLMGTPEVKGGSTVEEKFYLAGPRGFSGNLTDAQERAEASGSLHRRWQHPFGRHVGSIQIDIEDIVQSRPEQAAANRALEAETEKGLASEGQNIADKLIGRAGLAVGLGEYEETAGTPTGYPAFAIRFTDASDARNFQLRDRVVISTTDGTSDGDLVGEVGVVCGRDISLGYIQVATLDDPETAANPGDWVDDTTYYVFRVGEYADGNPDSIITSYERFLPASVASDTLHNVDRSEDSSLSGARLPASQEKGSMLTRAKRLFAMMYSRLGLKGKNIANDYIVLCNPEDWGVGAEELEGKGQRDAGAESTDEGYSMYSVHTVAGKLKFLPDPGKNRGTAMLLNKKLTKCYSASGKWFETIPDGSGNIIHLMPGRNVYEIRTLAKPATGIGAPYMHGVMSTDVD
jgi:hypothetical protein